VRHACIASGPSLKLVLNEEEVTVERIPDSDGDKEGWWWLATASKGGRLAEEQSGVRHAHRGSVHGWDRVTGFPS
jgi:hypothetical protein